MVDGRDKAIARIGMLRASIKAQEDEVKDIIASLGDLEPGKSVHAGWIMETRPTVRFDPAIAKRVLTPTQYDSILAIKPDSKLAKAVLDAEDYARTQKIYGTTVSVYRPTDEEE